MWRLSGVVVRTASLVCIVNAASTGSGRAQPVASFPPLQDVLDAGDLVAVEEEDGSRTKGKLTDISGSALVLRTAGVIQQTRSFPIDRLRSVSRIDSRLNGFLIGFAAGAVPGVLLGSALNERCRNESSDNCPGAIVLFGALFGGAGGWTGWEIDSAIDGETLVFSRSPASRSSRVMLAPAIGPRRAVVALSLKF